MKISETQIKKLKPCADGYAWYLKNGTTDLLETLLKVNVTHQEWARWLFTNMMSVRQRRQVAIYSAELVLHIFERKYPDDKRPREAIEAAKAALRSDTKKNRDAANAAAYAAYAAANAAYAANAADAAANAAYAAYAAYAAAYAANAAYAAHAAANAADAAADAANAAYAAYAAAYAADAAAYAARKEIQEKIIHEAVRILERRRSKG